MKTSYFANMKNITNPIAICGWVPKFYTGPRYMKLAPKKEWFFKWKELKNSGKYTDEEMEKMYIELYDRTVLCFLNPNDVWNELCAIYPDASSDDITLICYERPGDFCHRNLVSKWLREAGFDIEEFK